MEDNKSVKYIIYIVGFLAVLAVCWWLLGDPDVHDQRDRSDEVRTELRNAGNAQRDAEKHLDNAGGRIDRSVELADEIAGRISEAESRITDSAERNAECAGILADSERRIEESKRILQAVRERTQ